MLLVRFREVKFAERLIMHLNLIGRDTLRANYSMHACIRAIFRNNYPTRLPLLPPPPPKKRKKVKYTLTVLTKGTYWSIKLGIKANVIIAASSVWWMLRAIRLLGQRVHSKGKRLITRFTSLKHMVLSGPLIRSSDWEQRRVNERIGEEEEGEGGHCWCQ